MAVNIIVVFGTLIVGLTVGIAITMPDIPVVPLVVALGAFAIVMPIAIYPMSYTVWQAVDLAMHPPDDSIRRSRRPGCERRLRWCERQRSGTHSRTKGDT